MFREVKRRGISYFAFTELEEIPGLIHAFTSRQTDFTLTDDARPSEVASDKPKLLPALGVHPAQARTVRQVHSDRVVAPREDCSPAADGLLVTEPGQFAIVRTADCLPVLAVAPTARALCLVHAGWRGTRDHIVREGVERLLEATGCSAREVTAAFGPCIRVCCYQVGEEVLEQFSRRGHDLARVAEGRMLDLAAANRADLESLGVGRILDAELCTSCRCDLFFSYRKLGDRGRMWALAGFRQ